MIKNIFEVTIATEFQKFNMSLANVYYFLLLRTITHFDATMILMEKSISPFAYLRHSISFSRLTHHINSFYWLVKTVINIKTKLQ